MGVDTCADGPNRAATVQDQVSLSAQDQVDGAVRCAHVEGLEVSIEDQYWVFIGHPKLGKL